MTTRRRAEPPAPGLMDMFGGQELPTAPVEPPDPLWGALNVKWLKPLTGRHLCQDCVDLIHKNPGGPHPNQAVTRRKGPNDERMLCHAHAQIRKDADERVVRQHAARIAANKAAQKAAIGSKPGKRREHA